MKTNQDFLLSIDNQPIAVLQSHVVLKDNKVRKDALLAYARTAIALKHKLSSSAIGPIALKEIGNLIVGTTKIQILKSPVVMVEVQIAFTLTPIPIY